MTGRRTALEMAAAGRECLLCGGQGHVLEQDGEFLVWDLCVRCDGVFQLTAAKVAAALEPATASATVVRLVGQLELEDDPE